MDLCELAEGVHTVAYEDPLSADGKPITNGIGSTRNRAGELWKVGDRITEAEAFWLLRRDVEEAYWPCKNMPFWGEMTAGMRAAIADLNYNEGYAFEDGDHDTLDNALRQKAWNRVGVALQLYDNNDQLGLSRRRFAEWRLWRGDSPKVAYETAWGKNTVSKIMDAIALA